MTVMHENIKTFGAWPPKPPLGAVP